jgi:hypothetical protein
MVGSLIMTEEGLDKDVAGVLKSVKIDLDGELQENYCAIVAMLIRMKQNNITDCVGLLA